MGVTEKKGIGYLFSSGSLNHFNVLYFILLCTPNKMLCKIFPDFFNLLLHGFNTKNAIISYKKMGNLKWGYGGSKSLQKLFKNL